jgi:hypothetical protein
MFGYFFAELLEEVFPKCSVQKAKILFEIDVVSTVVIEVRSLNRSQKCTLKTWTSFGVFLNVLNQQRNSYKKEVGYFEVLDDSSRIKIRK